MRNIPVSHIHITKKGHFVQNLLEGQAHDELHFELLALNQKEHSKGVTCNF